MAIVNLRLFKVIPGSTLLTNDSMFVKQKQNQLEGNENKSIIWNNKSNRKRKWTQLKQLKIKEKLK